MRSAAIGCINVPSGAGKTELPVKIFKVSPRVYVLGMERLQVGRTAIGSVSSNSWDIAGAASAGLTTFWIQRSAGEPPEELGFGADRVVAAISDLAPLVRG